MIDEASFRRVLGHYPTGVCVVTAIDEDGAAAALVVGSFTSASLDPPLVAFFPGRRSTTWPRIEAVGRYCVNILADDQRLLCKQLAAAGPDKFTGVSHHLSANGSPRIEGSVAWIDCDLEACHEAGDHRIAIGRVTDLEVRNSVDPLVFLRGGFGTFAPHLAIA
ncbi:flavin reductase family protein [Sphingomonas tabacisoli]|uniref:Flavin reductase family protein n=1 Tax=Sphingomonas tabacisoli TaxID=2249466 RepID=A0ABW4I1Z2_9SPHN